MRNNPKLSNLFKGIGIVVFTIFLDLTYRLVVVPATLDFSYLGILGLVVACVIGVWVLPKSMRFRGSLYAAAIIMMLYGFQNVHDSSWFYQVITFVVIVLFFGYVLKRYGKIRIVWTAVTGLVAALLVIIFPMDKLPFLSHFTVQFSSPNLLDSSTSEFTVYPENVTQGKNGKGDTVTTFTNRPFTPITLDQMDPKRDTMLVSFRLNGSNTERTLLKANQLTDSIYQDLGTSGFPYHTFSLSKLKGHIQEDYYLTQEPEMLLQNVMNLGSFPLIQDKLENQTIQSDQSEWSSFQAENSVQTINQQRAPAENQISIQDHVLSGNWKGHSLHIVTDDSKFLGVAHLAVGQSEQVLTEGSNRIDVYDVNSGKLLATYNSTVDVPLPGSIITSDVDGDGQDEILLNTVPAQIIKLTPNGTWKTLWVSNRTSFQFECAGTLGNDSNTTIVANSPSELRNVDIRYITGYRYSNGSLERLWRISRPNFVMAQLVNQKGSIEQDLMMTDYGSQKIFVLKKHDVPVQEILYSMFGIYVIVSFIYFKKWRRGQHVQV